MRGIGLMLGVKMKSDSRAFVNHLREHGLLTVAAGDNVMRAAALIVEGAHIPSSSSACPKRRATRCRGGLNRRPNRHICHGPEQRIKRPLHRRGDRLRAAAAACAGRLVRIGPALEEILSSHDYPAPIARLLSEALVLTALLGATLKDAGGQLTLQTQTEAGIVDLLVCDFRAGELRGYVRFDPERLAEQPSQPSLFSLFGKGYLAITFDQALSNERYQGIVPLEGGSLAEAVEHFFVQSEQIPSLVRVAVDDSGKVAGGILLQHLPEGEEGRERLHTRLDHPEWACPLSADHKDVELRSGLPLDPAGGCSRGGRIRILATAVSRAAAALRYAASSPDSRRRAVYGRRTA